MSAEDRNGQVSTDEECTDCTERERSFDAVARGLANGSISRRKALRVLGASLVGSVMASIPGVALAKPPPGTCKPLNAKCRTNTECCSNNCETRNGKLVCGPAVQCTGSGQGNCPQPASECLQVLCSASGFCGAAQAKPNGTGCNDGDPCTVNDTCQAGVCTPGGPKDCDDNNECTTDLCNPTTGVCEHTPLTGTPCDDNDPCTTGDICNNGQCVGAAVNCGQCLRCNASTGICEADPDQIGDTCNDNDPCTENDRCLATGVCAGTPRVCPTGQICVSGTCQCPAGTCGTGCTGTTCGTGTSATCCTSSQTCCVHPTTGAATCCNNSNQICCASGRDEGTCRNTNAGCRS